MNFKNLKRWEWVMLIIAWISATMTVSLLLFVETSLPLFLIGLLASLIAVGMTILSTIVAYYMARLIFNAVKSKTTK